MRTRFAWWTPVAVTALAALTATLSGCVVIYPGAPSPRSLAGYRIELTNKESGGPLMEHAPAVTLLPIDDRAVYQFKSATEAFDSALNQALHWSYEKDSYRGATFMITFAYDRLSDLETTCGLRFHGYLSGTHRCESVLKGTRTITKAITHSGWSTGTFRLERLE